MPRRFSPQQLIEKRTTAGLSRDDLAEAIKRTFWSVQAWELGNGVPSGRSLAAIADVLSCSIDDLFEDVGA